MKVVVVGGSGFVGRRTVAALQRFPGVEVAVAGRHGPVLVDVLHPASFASLAPFDVVVDLTDGTSQRPDELVAWCLSNGKTIVEATSDAETVRRLARRHRASSGPGRLVLGGGLFTGVSNLMARDASEAVGGARALTFAVASSPYSGAGAGTVALMAEAAARPAVRTVDGVRREEAPGRGPPLVFGGRPRPTYRMSLAEAEMLPTSTGAADVDVLFAFKPAFLVTVFALTPAWMRQARWFRALLELNFSLLRRVVLRRVPSKVELVAIARGADGREARREVRCDDGMDACAWALAGLTETVAKTPPARTFAWVDDVAGLDALLSRVNAVAGRTVLHRAE